MREKLSGLYGGCRLNGNRTKLNRRFRKIQIKQQTNPQFAKKVLTYRDIPGKPLTVTFHGKTFNGVDRIDLMYFYLQSPGFTNSNYISIMEYVHKLLIIQSHSYSTDSLFTMTIKQKLFLKKQEKSV